MRLMRETMLPILAVLILTVAGSKAEQCTIKDRELTAQDDIRKLSDCPCYHRNSNSYSCPNLSTVKVTRTAPDNSELS